MGTRRRTTDHLFGNCWTAQLIECGAVKHEQEAKHWHHRCRGAVTQGNGSLVRCTCPCHAERQICLSCGEPGQELGEDLRCLEKERCTVNIERRLENNEIAQQVHAAQRGAQEGVREVTERTRRQKVAAGTGGVCEHCGEPTKGGRFLPGHDAKMKSELRKRAAGGDTAAKEELARRGW